MRCAAPQAVGSRQTLKPQPPWGTRGIRALGVKDVSKELIICRQSRIPERSVATQIGEDLSPIDPLRRETPRSAVEGLLRCDGRGDFECAVRYLQPLRPAGGYRMFAGKAGSSKHRTLTVQGRGRAFLATGCREGDKRKMGDDLRDLLLQPPCGHNTATHERAKIFHD